MSVVSNSVRPHRQKPNRILCKFKKIQCLDKADINVSNETMWIEAFTNNLSFLISVYRRFKDIKKKGQQRPLVGTISRWTQVFKNIELQKATPKQKPTSQPDNNNNNKKPAKQKTLGFLEQLRKFHSSNQYSVYLCACMHGCSVASYSLRPHGLYPARLCYPWGFSREEE